MKTITVDELRMACIEQANTNLKVVFKCPMCGCLQMGQDLDSVFDFHFQF